MISLEAPGRLTPSVAGLRGAVGNWSPAFAADYWERRAQRYAPRGRGLAAVCSYGMPSFYNAYIANTQRRALLPWLDEAARRSGGRALDLGCGVGRWSVELAIRGFEVTGVDVSPSMIAHAEALARARRVPCSFLVGDLNALHLNRQFDLIISVTVLQHLLDERKAREAIARLAAHLAPGGRIMLLEAAPTRATTQCDTEVFCARTVRWYRDALQAAGLSVSAELGVDPSPFKTWLLPHYRAAPRWLRWAPLAAVTAVSWPLDALFAPYLVRHSWHKLMIAEHGGPSAPKRG